MGVVGEHPPDETAVREVLRCRALPVLERERLKRAERVLHAGGRPRLERSLGHDADEGVSDFDLTHQGLSARAARGETDHPEVLS